MSTPAGLEDFLIAVGKVTGNAGVADLAMFNVFRLCSGLNLETAKAIYYTLDAHQTRASLVRRTMRAKEWAEKETALATTVIDATGTANKLRNELAHALIRTTNPDIASPFHRIVPRQMGEQPKLVSIEYLKSMVNQTGAAVTKAHAGWVELCTVLGASPEMQF
jgi:hypothetical protein